MTVLGVILFMLAIVCYAIVQTLQLRHEYSVWQNSYYKGFWGTSSWLRKYSKELKLAPKTWYYKYFKLSYKERFPGSATIFVFVTDAMHFFQFMFFNLLCLSVALFLFTEWSILINFILLRVLVWIVWGLFFEHLLVKK